MNDSDETAASAPAGKVVDLATGQDLESLRLAEEVAESEDFSSALIDASVDGIVTYDRECRYTLFSPSMERLTGLTAKEVLGRVAFDVFPFLKEVGTDRMYAASLEGRAVRSAIVPYRVPETGAEGFTEQQNLPLFDESGAVTGGMAIIRDVTKMKHRFDSLLQQKREVEARVRALEEELAGVRGPTAPNKT